MRMVGSYLKDGWHLYLMFDPDLLSLLSIALSYPYYPSSAPLLPQPASSFRISTHFRLILGPHSFLSSPSPVIRHVPGPSPNVFPLRHPNADPLHCYLPVPLPPSCLDLKCHWLTSPPITSYISACRLSSLFPNHPVCAAWLRLHDPNAKLVTVYYLPSLSLSSLITLCITNYIYVLAYILF